MRQSIPTLGRGLVTCAVLLFGFALSAAPPPTKVAFTNARIIPVNGAEIEQGTVLVENGRITAVGADVKLPYDAMEVDCEGKVLFPGMVHPQSARGLDIANEAVAIAPYLDVYDAIDPASLTFEEYLRNGLTSVHMMQGNNLIIGAVSRVVRPIGLTPDEMTLKAAVALKWSTTPRRQNDRMEQLAKLRGAFLELEDYLGRVAEARYEEERKNEGKEVDVPPDEAREKGRSLVRDIDLDDPHRNLQRMMKGAIGTWAYCGTATDVAPAVRIATEQGLLDRTIFVIGADTHRAVKELEAAGRPVVLPEDLTARSRDPFTGDVTETFIPKVLYDAGIPFAVQPNSDGSLPERYPTYQAARLVRNGIPRAAALRAITLNPAQFLGLGDEIGSIEVGKRGDIVIMNGDPLDFSTWIDQVWIDGMLAYDRARDPRLKELTAPPEEEESTSEEGEKKDAEEGAEKSEDEGSKKEGAKEEGGDDGKGDGN